ncbi:hypothetical protein CPB86DRAFT_798562 [Serendipita vermifera]|nr:hypothetical protein CPB86DRAFT_798562 [Serendipita vermifera]
MYIDWTLKTPYEWLTGCNVGVGLSSTSTEDEGPPISPNQPPRPILLHRGPWAWLIMYNLTGLRDACVEENGRDTMRIDDLHAMRNKLNNRDNLYASLPQSTLSSLFARARTITHLTTKTWLDAGIPKSFKMPHLEIIEANFGVEVHGDTIKCLQNSPRLRHLTLMGSSQTLFPGLVLSPSLQTLHLSIIGGHPTALLFVLSRLRNLKELYLNYMVAAIDTGSISHENVMTSDTFPSLNFLCIKHCHSSYVSAILIPPIIKPGTNVYLEADTIEGPIRLDRRETASTLWVDTPRSNSFLIEHQTSLTEIILKEKGSINLLSQLADFMNCHRVTSINLGGHFPTREELSSFPSLVQLVILFRVTPGDVKDRSLAATLNQYLPLLCPQLRFIGLILQRLSPLKVAYVDGTRSIIEEFLDHWRSAHNRPFNTIQIQDEINPLRWGPGLASLLETRVQSFGLGNVQSDPQLSFPSTRHTFRTKILSQ